jgi:hypothetical protein
MRLALKTGQRLMKKKKKVAADRVTRLKPRRNIYKTLLLNFAGVGFSLEQSARKSGFFFTFVNTTVPLSAVCLPKLSDKKCGLRKPEAGFLVRVHPEPCLILSRAQIRALLCSSKSKFIPA